MDKQEIKNITNAAEEIYALRVCIIVIKGQLVYMGHAHSKSLTVINVSNKMRIIVRDLENKIKSYLFYINGQKEIARRNKTDLSGIQDLDLDLIVNAYKPVK